jgi:hypothetical protein
LIEQLLNIEEQLKGETLWKKKKTE